MQATSSINRARRTKVTVVTKGNCCLETQGLVSCGISSLRPAPACLQVIHPQEAKGISAAGQCWHRKETEGAVLHACMVHRTTLLMAPPEAPRPTGAGQHTLILHPSMGSQKFNKGCQNTCYSINPCSLLQV